MIDSFSEYCAPGARALVEMIPVSSQVSLRVISFTPAEANNNPPVVFVPGWISHLTGWQAVLRELTRDFKVYCIETREKISSQIRGKAEFSVAVIGQDLSAMIEHFGLKKRYVLLGSSLGATAILDCCRSLKTPPLALVLIVPNAEFRVPMTWKIIITLLPPRLYLLVKPAVKWYLRNFRLDIHTDMAQYKKYCTALDEADPWKLKKAVLALAKYQVWDLLAEIDYPTLIVNASKDVLHEPENLVKMAAALKNGTSADLETNSRTHSIEMVELLRKYLADNFKPGKEKK